MIDQTYSNSIFLARQKNEEKLRKVKYYRVSSKFVTYTYLCLEGLFLKYTDLLLLGTLDVEERTFFVITAWGMQRVIGIHDAGAIFIIWGAYDW